MKSFFKRMRIILLATKLWGWIRYTQKVTKYITYTLKPVINLFYKIVAEVRKNLKKNQI